MKKIRTLLFTLLGAVSLGIIGGVSLEKQAPIVAEAASYEVSDVITREEVPDNYLYVVLSDFFWGEADADIYVHYWGGNTSTSWPGVKLEYDSELNLLYTDEFDSSSLHLIFSRWAPGTTDFSGNPWHRCDRWSDTENGSTLSGNQFFFNVSRDWFNDYSINSLDTYHLLAEMPSSWETPHVHRWQEFGSYGTQSGEKKETFDTEWPGVALTKVQDDYNYELEDDYSLYFGEFKFFNINYDGQYNGLIFNNGNGNAQTDTLSNWANNPNLVFKVESSGPSSGASSRAYLLDDGATRRKAYDFLRYYRSLRKPYDGKENSICWLLEDAHKDELNDLFTKYSEVETLVSGLNDDGTCTIGNTISDLQGRISKDVQPFFAFNGDKEETTLLLVLGLSFGFILLLGGYFFFKKRNQRKSSL